MRAIRLDGPAVPAPGGTERAQRLMAHHHVAGAMAMLVLIHLISMDSFAIASSGSPGPSAIVEQAEVICTGTVLSTECQWREDHRGRHVYTQVSLGVAQCIKGGWQGPTLDLEVVGGTVDGITEAVSNMPVFTTGERVLLFLKGRPLHTVDGAVGKVPIFGNQVFWNGRTIPVDVLATSLGLGQVQVFAEPNEVRLVQLAQVPPSIDAIVPDIGSAGTDTEVTISGTGFGQTQGSGKVEFFYRDSQPKVPAEIVSWADEQIVCIVPVGKVNNDAAFAGTGAVTVTTVGGTSNRVLFHITFGYGQHKWPGTNPVVTYYVNENAPYCTGVLEAIRAAAETWNSTGASFRFEYAATDANAAYGYDGHNELLWGDVPDGHLALTYFWWDAGGALVECDTVFNSSDPNYSWSTERTVDDNVFDQMDVQTTALHEFGHWLKLLDLYGVYGADKEVDKEKVMYGNAVWWTSLCEWHWEGMRWECHYKFAVRRDLHADDVGGIHYIYPPVVPPVQAASIEYPSTGRNAQYFIFWDRSPQASSYQLDCSSDGGASWFRVYTGSSTHFYIQFYAAAVKGMAHRYRVRACNAVGFSDWQTGTWDCIEGDL